MSVNLPRLWLNGVEITGDVEVKLDLRPDPLAAVESEEWPSSRSHFLTEETVSGSITTEISADDYACWMEFTAKPAVYAEVVGGPFDGATVPLDLEL